MFIYNQLMIVSSRQEARVGTLYAPEQYYLEWKDPYPKAKEDMDQIIISLCSLRPYSIDELKVILQRNQKALKRFKIKALLESKQLFYWIPEMIRHPQQKYIANPSMARSKTKNNNKNDHK